MLDVYRERSIDPTELVSCNPNITEDRSKTMSMTFKSGLEDELEAVFGLDFDTSHYDHLIKQHIKPERQEIEDELLGRKWFDYRFMHPVQATYVYAHAYNQVYPRVYRRTICHRRARFIRPLWLDVFRDKNSLQGIWGGRQCADELCMPYTLYIQMAMDGALRYWNHKHLPRPNQLYTERVIKYVCAAWESHQEGFLLIAKHSHYRNENYVGAAHQDAHHEWLIKQAGKRTNIFLALADLYDSKVLPIEKIRAAHGAEVAERILAGVR